MNELNEKYNQINYSKKILNIKTAHLVKKRQRFLSETNGAQQLAA